MLTYALESGNLVLLESILKMVPDLMEEHLVACLKLILLSIRKPSMDSFITMWAGGDSGKSVCEREFQQDKCPGH